MGLPSQIVHRNVEEALDLGGVQVHGQHPVRARGGEHVGHQLGGDGVTGLGLAVLPGIAVVGDDRGDAAGGGALQRVDHDEQLHEIVVHRGAGGLDHEHVAAADRLVQGDENLPVGEGTDLRLAQFGSHQLADLLRQLRIGVAGKHLDVLAVRNHCLNALFLCSECSWFLSVGSISRRSISAPARTASAAVWPTPPCSPAWPWPRPARPRAHPW